MVIDTSAIVAILLGEPQAERLAEAIEQGAPRRLSAASLLEASIVIEARKGEDGVRDLDLLVYRSGIEIVPFDEEQSQVARLAWRRYGKGRHPAGLNLGDCFSYALAKVTGSALLYIGKDFSQTDVA
ncbi:MAG: type II toxin-antitoxin system VapC family toxin [Pseudomonadota bacterium]|nr:type II toxin-antitoxin system VapC family toxin [Pseudomonadota bacterium]